MPKPPKPIETKTNTRLAWDHFDVLKDGAKIVVTVDGQTLLDYTVPAGKKFRARLAVDGDLETS